jgi:hypothetical protein
VFIVLRFSKSIRFRRFLQNSGDDERFRPWASDGGLCPVTGPYKA